MEVTIRPCKSGDLTRIASMWLAAYEEIASSDMPLGHNAARVLHEWLSDRLRDRNALSFVAEVEGALAGFLLGRTGEWNSEPPILEPRRLGLIDAVFVSRPYRRMGVGTKLVEQAIEKAESRGIVRIEATFQTQGQAASSMWLSLGFVPWLMRAYRRSEEPDPKRSET